MKEKKIRVIFVLLVALLLCVGCEKKEEVVENPYDREWVVGKTREEIEEKYGEMDSFKELDAWSSGFYIISEDTEDIWGFKEYGIRFRINFDSEGKATEAGVESNGVGG